jgi:hypothetical protein
MSDAKICMDCFHGRVFKPRADEIERYGVDVMGCQRSGWEGYTGKYSTCEAFYPKPQRTKGDAA